jgi:hypothetical protein
MGFNFYLKLFGANEIGVVKLKSAFTLYLIKNTKFIQRKAEVNYQIRQAYDLYRALVLCLLLESR